MKIITLIAQQISPAALSTALPADGIVSVTISETQTFSRSAVAVESYRGQRVARHTESAYRVEILADEAADLFAAPAATLAASA